MVSSQAARISREDKRIVSTLDYSDVTFPVSEKGYGVIEDKNSICVNVFSYENTVYPVYVSKKSFDDFLNMLMIHEGDKSHYVYIKDFNRLMFSITGNKNKKWFCTRCLQGFSSKNVLNRHKSDCLVINGEQRVKLSEGFFSFKNYSRQMRVPFKIYADFECILKENDENNVSSSSWTKKYQDHVSCGFGYKVVCVDDKFTGDVVVYRGKDCVNKFIKSILPEYEYCNDVIKDYFNKNLIMSVKEEELSQLANKCCICGKLYDLVDEKVRDHCHVSGNFSCNANFKISKKVPVVFHNLKGYDGHLIMK